MDLRCPRGHPGVVEDLHARLPRALRRSRCGRTVSRWSAGSSGATGRASRATRRSRAASVRRGAAAARSGRRAPARPTATPPITSGVPTPPVGAPGFDGRGAHDVGGGVARRASVSRGAAAPTIASVRRRAAFRRRDRDSPRADRLLRRRSPLTIPAPNSGDERSPGATLARPRAEDRPAGARSRAGSRTPCALGEPGSMTTPAPAPGRGRGERKRREQRPRRRCESSAREPVCARVWRVRSVSCPRQRSCADRARARAATDRAG